MNSEEYIIRKNKKLEKENEQLKELLSAIRYGFDLHYVVSGANNTLESIDVKNPYIYKIENTKLFNKLVKYFELDKEE